MWKVKQVHILKKVRTVETQKSNFLGLKGVNATGPDHPLMCGGRREWLKEGFREFKASVGGVAAERLR